MIKLTTFSKDVAHALLPKHSELAIIFCTFEVEKRPIDFPAIFNWGADDL